MRFAPMTRLVLDQRKRLKAARDANTRLAIHVARQDAHLANLRADLAAQEHTIRALMQTAPSTIEELQADG